MVKPTPLGSGEEGRACAEVAEFDEEADESDGAEEAGDADVSEVAEGDGDAEVVPGIDVVADDAAAESEESESDVAEEVDESDGAEEADVADESDVAEEVDVAGESDVAAGWIDFAALSFTAFSRGSCTSMIWDLWTSGMSANPSSASSFATASWSMGKSPSGRRKRRERSTETPWKSTWSLWLAARTNTLRKEGSSLPMEAPATSPEKNQAAWGARTMGTEAEAFGASPRESDSSPAFRSRLASKSRLASASMAGPSAG